MCPARQPVFFQVVRLSHLSKLNFRNFKRQKQAYRAKMQGSASAYELEAIENTDARGSLQPFLGILHPIAAGFLARLDNTARCSIIAKEIRSVEVSFIRFSGNAGVPKSKGVSRKTSGRER